MIYSVLLIRFLPSNGQVTLMEAPGFRQWIQEWPKDKMLLQSRHESLGPSIACLAMNESPRNYNVVRNTNDRHGQLPWLVFEQVQTATLVRCYQTSFSSSARNVVLGYSSPPLIDHLRHHFSNCSFLPPPLHNSINWQRIWILAYWPSGHAFVKISLSNGEEETKTLFCMISGWL